VPRKLTVAIAALAAALAALPGAFARPGADPGVGSNEILLGGTTPLTGVAAAYASVARGADAYFKHVNATRRVHGRMIRYKFVDDAYNPAQTVQATRELVQQDRVFAIFNSLGTEHNLATRSYLNAVKVPQVFVGSGATTFGRDYRRYPMTIGYLPSYVGEGRVYARHILKTKPNAKIGILYQDDPYGRDLLDGFRRSLGPKRRNIVATQSYDPLTSTDVSSQMARLKSSGAKVFMLIATPRQAIQAMVAKRRLGWSAQIYVNQVGSATNIMRIVEATAGRASVVGAITLAAYKDPTSPRFRNDRGMRLYRQIMARYNPRGDVNDVFHVYSMAVAHTMVTALRQAGRNLTRQSLLRAVNNLNERNNPFLLPGVRLRTTPRDHFPLEQGQLQRWRGGYWAPLGALQSTRP
jgi:branched-chain amino acid transport system substrate-binding protein